MYRRVPTTRPSSLMTLASSMNSWSTRWDLGLTSAHAVAKLRRVRQRQKPPASRQRSEKLCYEPLALQTERFCVTETRKIVCGFVQKLSTDLICLVVWTVDHLVAIQNLGRSLTVFVALLLLPSCQAWNLRAVGGGESVAGLMKNTSLFFTANFTMFPSLLVLPRASPGHGPGITFIKFVPELKLIYYAEKGSNILKVRVPHPQGVLLALMNGIHKVHENTASVDPPW